MAYFDKRQRGKNSRYRVDETQKQEFNINWTRVCGLQGA